MYKNFAIGSMSLDCHKCVWHKVLSAPSAASVHRLCQKKNENEKQNENELKHLNDLDGVSAYGPGKQGLFLGIQKVAQ
jgi:hypothetical protein